MPSLILALIFLVSYHCVCQDRLVFIKDRNHVAQYYQGDWITLKLKGERLKLHDQIRGFHDSLIVFKDYEIDPSQVSHIYVDNKTKNWFFLKYKYDKLFLFAGIGFVLLDFINTWELSEQTLAISGIMISAGILAKLLISKSSR